MPARPRPAAYAPYEGPTQADPSPLYPPRFLGLLPHPGNRAPNAPPRPTLGSLPEGWTRSFHAVPAAYPRQLRSSHGSNSRDSHPFADGPIPSQETKAHRAERISKEAEKLMEARYSAEEWTLEEARRVAPPGQFIAVERWYRNEPRGGSTLICTHANGTTKEHWHPVLHDLITRVPDAVGYQFGTTRLLSSPYAVIDDIWLFDEASHAASCDLNAGLLGNAETWTDFGRDIVNFAAHVLPFAKVQPPSSLPWQLEWSTEGTSPAVKIIGLGASFGGAAQVQAAHTRPDLFQGVFLVDGMVSPKIVPYEQFQREGIETFIRARGALSRRDYWPSRAAARKALGSLAFFQAWHPNIFDLYISHGLVPVDYARPHGPVRLSTPGWAEGTVFCEPYAAGRGWDMLPNMKVPVGFLMAANAERTLGENITNEVVWTPPLARNERCVKEGHLILQENPKVAADSAWRFLQTIGAGEWGSSSEDIRASYVPELRAKL